MISRRNFLATAVAIAATPAFGQTRPNPPIWLGDNVVELPRFVPSVIYPPMTGVSIPVGIGGDLQGAINAASLGDEIVIDVGFTNTGEYSLPDKGAGPGTVVIRSANSHLLPAGVRVSPTDASNMPTLTAGTVSAYAVFRGEDNAHNYRFVGLEIESNPGSYVNSLQYFNRTNHHLTWDRCFIHGNDNFGCRRSGQYDGNNIVFIENHISNFWENGADSQAIWWREGFGHLIHNNFLEGAGENILTGGAGFEELHQPTDITVTKNTFYKRDEWWRDGPLWDGQRRTVKNLIEFKLGNRILTEGNDFFNFWRAGQDAAVVYKSTDQYGETPTAQVHNVTHRYNLHVGMNKWMAISSNGVVGGGVSMPVNDVLITDNLVLDMNLTKQYTISGGGQTWAVSMYNLHDNITIAHNTMMGANTEVDSSATPWVEGFTTNFAYKDNLYTQGRYGWSASSLVGNHMACIATHCPDVDMAGNVMISDRTINTADRYPPGNFAPLTIADVGFVNYQDAYTGDPNDYALDAASIYKGQATDGDDPGCRIDRFIAARA
jgi:hypothetical protein